MSDDRALPPEGADPDMAAAELALGVLDGDERAAALRRVLAEPPFAREVARWRAYFAQLFAAWPAVAPPEGLFARIEATLDGGATPVLRRTGWWPAIAGVATVAAACLALVLLLRPASPPVLPTPAPARAVPVLVATLAPTDTTSEAKPVAALYDPATSTLRVGAAPLASAGKAAELWVIPADGAPRSMGLLDAAAATPVPVGPDRRALLAPGATLAVSIEPPGGSPTDTPTGPVVAAGTLALI